jgi:hypothetical protein
MDASKSCTNVGTIVSLPMGTALTEMLCKDI